MKKSVGFSLEEKTIADFFFLFFVASKNVVLREKTPKYACVEELLYLCMKTFQAAQY